MTPAALEGLSLEETTGTLEDFTALFGAHEVGEKDGPSIIPGVLIPCPDECRGTGKVNCGGNAQHRLKANVTAMTMLGVDLDSITEERASVLFAALESRGIAFWCWHTHSHTPEDWRMRLMVPFSIPLPLTNPRQWSEVAWPALIRYLGLDGAAAADQACKDPCRIYYLPRKPLPDSPHRAGFSPGELLDWQPILGESLKAMAAVPSTLAPSENEDPTRPVDLDDVKKRLHRAEKGLLGTILRRVQRGAAPVPPPDERKPGEMSRYQAWRTLTAHLANVAHPWESSVALLEVLREAHAAEAKDSPQDYTAWETIEQLFETGRSNAPAWHAQKEAERKAELAAFKRTLEAIHTRQTPAAAGAPGPTIPSIDSAPVEGAEPEADRWAEGLILVHKKSGPEIKSCAANVKHILEHHPAWRGVLRRNEMDFSIEMHGGPLAEPGQVRTLGDSDAGRVADWMQRELGIDVHDSVAWDRVIAVAEAHAYNPVQDYLKALVWDGVPRAASMLSSYFSATVVDSEGNDIRVYVEAVSKRWLISLAARALRPGCKVDTILILESVKQGIGKSTSLGVLTEPWFTDTKIHIGDKDSMMLAAKVWLVEIGELSSMRKADVELLKTWFSSREDQMRLPYGRTIQKFPRRCVMVGTTNRDDYLQDPTGNRRYWPVRCAAVDTAALRADRDQILAEAVALFNAGEQWWFTDEEQAIADVQAGERVTEETSTEVFSSWYLAQQKRPRTLTYVDVFNALGKPPGAAVKNEIGTLVRTLGFRKVRLNRGGRRMWVYEAPWALFSAPQTGKTTAEKVAAATPEPIHNQSEKS